MNRAVLVFFLAWLSVPAMALQSTAPVTAPAAKTAGTQLLTGVIIDVKGLAEIRPNEDSDWKLCEKGQLVPENSQIRTGTRSTVTIELPHGQKFTVERLTICQLLRSQEQGNLVVTDIGMKYGRTDYQIEGGGVEYRSTIRSPNSTLAVRGTVVSLYDQRPFTPQAISYTGRAVYNSGRRTVSFGGKNAGRTEVRAQQDPASVAMNNAVQDPVNAFARTAQEIPLVTNLLSSGAVFTVPNGRQIPTVSGGIPPSDSQLLSILPGQLDFILRWSANADLNLVVGNQSGTGEVLLPATGLNTTPSGGRIPFNHLGGPSGGIEIAYWPHSFPTGTYFAAAEHVSGPSSPFTINAFEHGQPVQILNPNGNGGAGQFVTQFSATSDPGTAVGVIVPLGVPAPPVAAEIHHSAGRRP